jgi:tetratricopeptide (TPR) repeat protein
MFSPPTSSPVTLSATLRPRPLCTGVLSLSLALFLSFSAACATQVPEQGAVSEFWRGTITIHAHEGKGCIETSQGSALPYRRVMMLELQSLTSGHSQGFAWGDMVATRLRPLEFAASSRAGGPGDVSVMGPANFLSLTWLPTGGAQSPGVLAKSAGFVFKKERDLLSGQWRERMGPSQQSADQCLWSEASVLLERVNPAHASEIAQEARALQASIHWMDAQLDLPAKERWSVGAIAQLLSKQEGVEPKGYGARTLLPLMSKLAEQLVLDQEASKAAPILARTIGYLEGLMDHGPMEYAAYVTHLTPLLRMAGMLEVAERLNRQSISLLMSQGHGRSPELARLLSGYGALLVRIKAFPQALQIYEQALAIERFVNEGKHIGVVIGLVNLSRVCEVLGATERSIRLAQEASELHESLGLGPLKMELQRGGYSSKV